MKVLDIQKLREETPACRKLLHFNNAGAALPPFQVVDAVKQHLDLESNIGGYEAAQASYPLSEKIYHQAAQLIQCSSNEIAFVENATRAWEMIFYSFHFTKGDKILTCVSEYASNYLAFLHQAKRTGVSIEVIPDDEYGQLDIAALEKEIDSKVKLIAITHIPTQGGLINPAKKIGNLARSANIPYLLDTTQSVGQMPIDVNEIGCDFLCATGRKYLRGPRGTGFLYAKKSRLETLHPPFVDLQAATWISENEYVLRDDARRFETWEQNIAAKIGLGVAIDYALQLGLPAIWQRIQHLASMLRTNLAKIPFIVLQDLGQDQCGIVTFTSEKFTPYQIQQHLAKEKVNVSISLQEYARLDMTKRNLPALVRASVHYYNTETEVERFCEILSRLK